MCRSRSWFSSSTRRICCSTRFRLRCSRRSSRSCGSCAPKASAFISSRKIRADVPDNVLGQLGNRVQHALRAFTPRDQKAVQTAADTFRANPKINTAQAIMELGVGEALISCLDEKGQPQVVERAFIVPPRSQLGPISPQQRQQLLANSLVAGVYDQVVDRESAYEKLTQVVQAAPPPQPRLNHPGEVFGAACSVGEAMLPRPSPLPRPAQLAARGVRRIPSER
jgi:hypothetical protein